MHENHPPQGMSGFMPMPMIIAHQASPSLAPSNEPPARVQVALAYLRALTLKTMRQAAVNDISIELIPGQTLTGEEALAQIEACRLLKTYFKGGFTLDEWEAGQQKTPPGSTVIACPRCQQLGRPRQDCQLCHGTGFLHSFPAT